VAVVLATLVVTAPPASAATQTKTFNLAYSGDTTKTIVDTGAYVCDYCIPDVFFDDPARTNEEFGLGAEVKVDVKLAFDAPATDDVTYNDSLLRQGETLDVANKLTPTQGKIHVGLDVSGAFGIYEKGGDAPDTLPDWTQTTATVHKSGEIAGVDIDCTLPLQGESPRDCAGPDETIDIFSVPVAPGVSIALKLKYKFVVTVTSEGVLSVRKAEVVGGQAIGDKDLTWDGTSPDTIHDNIAIGCSQPSGNDLTYALTGNSVDVGTKLSTVLTPQIGIDLDVFPDPSAWDIVDIPVDLVDFPDMTMTAADAAPQILGAVQKDNVPPVADAGGAGPNHTYAGAEGAAVAFDGSGSADNCPVALRWDFSDGGVAFGPHPSHTFADNGHYTGQLTATDQAGNATTQAFEVEVSNQNPAAIAGLATTADWGRPIAFNGQATDPSSVDLNSLAFTWDFGDGSPSATGAKNAIHSYGAPGSYTAHLTVADKDGGTDGADRGVTVTKRNTALVYTGATSGGPNKVVTLSATLSDEYGQPVVGRKVTFTVGAQTADGYSNSSGVAAVALKLNQKPGSYPLSAVFAEDSHYFGANTAALTFSLKK
jgi:PKD repeat protein